MSVKSRTVIARIRYVSASRVPSQDANAVHVLHMCDAFAQRGLDVTLYAERGAAGSIREHYGLQTDFRICFQTRRRHRLWLLWRCLRRRECDAATVWFGRRPLSLSRLAVAGYPVALELHHPPRTAKQSVALERLVGAPRFIGLVVISEQLRQALLSRLPQLAPERVFVAHDGVPAKHLREPRINDRQRVRAVYCGSFHFGKGVETIVEAAARVPDIAVELIGGTVAQIDALRVGAPANVRFIGHLPYDAAQRRLLEYDIALAPYGAVVRGTKTPGHESLAAWMSPLKIFEYMAAGLPMVTSDLPVLREILQPGVEAVMTEPGDPNALAAAMRALAADPALRLRIAMAAQARLQGFTWEHRARAVVRFLETQPEQRPFT
ncbi:MAG TPA: glycosyltransferase family 4 protein [Steroidobacteraceae bacterium]|nr:glycosyltransferase family 4 protein [Steroidobacteraceae bacterium]